MNNLKRWISEELQIQHGYSSQQRQQTHVKHIATVKATPRKCMDLKDLAVVTEVDDLRMSKPVKP